MLLHLEGCYILSEDGRLEDAFGVASQAELALGGFKRVNTRRVVTISLTKVLMRRWRYSFEPLAGA
jgi:hypothetical protein